MSAPVCECLLYSIAIISEQFVLLDYTSHIEFMIDKRATRVVIQYVYILRPSAIGMGESYLQQFIFK